MGAHEKSRDIYDSFINKAADIFHALSHPLRLSICLELYDDERSVSELCEKLHQPQHSASQQLALLKRGGLLTARKQSRQVYYSVSNEHLTLLLKCVKKHAPHTAEMKASSFLTKENFDLQNGPSNKPFEVEQFSLVYDQDR